MRRFGIFFHSSLVYIIAESPHSWQKWYSRQPIFDTYGSIKDLFWISSKANETHRLWSAGRGWQVVVAELIPVTWPKTSHLIGSYQIFYHDHDRIMKTDREYDMCAWVDTFATFRGCTHIKVWYVILMILLPPVIPIPTAWSSTSIPVGI